MFGKWIWLSAAVVEGNPDDAAAEKLGRIKVDPLLYGLWSCHAQFGTGADSILFSIALSCK